jgi:MYXO-CTERM domain-containing protein
VRALAVLAAAAALVTAATVPYVRSRTDRSSPDGGHCLGWPAGTVEFRQNAAGVPEAGDAGFLAMDHALATWATAMDGCGNLTLRMGSRTTSRTTGFDDHPGASNENVLLFRTRLCTDVVSPSDPCNGQGTCGNDHDCWQYNAGTLAITTTTYNVRTGKLYDADLEMNASTHIFSTVDSPPCSSLGQTGCVSTDVQNTVTHELGHALGLDHSPDSRSTMFAGAELGETSKRVLDDGSVEFVCTAYPAGRPTMDCDGTTPIDLSEDTAGSCSVAPTGPFALLSLALLGLRRRPGGR